MVVSGRPMDQPRVSYVDSQNRRGAKAAVSHLIASGRQTVATVHGTLDLPSAVDRLEGYHDALREAGRSIDPSLEAPGEYRATTAFEAMNALLRRHPNLDAVFVASDSMAIAAMQAIRESGRRVPQDVAVIGFDDLPTARESRPTLSTVRQPIEAMGREMVRLVLQQISDPDSAASQVVFATELVLRGSTGDSTEEVPVAMGADEPVASVPSGV